MEIDPSQLSPGRMYATMTSAITPRPIAWVSTVSPGGIPNLAPFSYFAGVCSRPPVVMISVVNRPDGTPKDTLRNIEANGQFVVNIVTRPLAQAMLVSSIDFEYETSEFEAAGLTPRASTHVAPPFVAESPIQMECQLLQRVPIGSGPSGVNALFGHIVWLRIDDQLLDDQQHLDGNLLETIGRMSGSWYCSTQDRFELRP